MEGQFEAIRQQLLHHRLHLFLVRPAFHVRLGLDVIKIGAEPGRCIDDLLGVQPICKGDEIIQIGIASHKVIPSETQTPCPACWEHSA